jgi:hypothetical protein
MPRNVQSDYGPACSLLIGGVAANKYVQLVWALYMDKYTNEPAARGDEAFVTKHDRITTLNDDLQHIIEATNKLLAQPPKPRKST